MTFIEILDSTISPNLESDCELDSSINVEELSYNAFFCKYLIPNKPCIIQSNVTKDWLCRKNWIQNETPNFSLLHELFDDCIVPVADCNKRYYNSHQKNEMLVKNFLNYWQQLRINNYHENASFLYLKDWHCKKDHPEMKFYDVPKYFASDWLNEYFTGQKELNDDYMFVYIGPKGTWTPFHADVFSSYSWSANVYGKKRWLIFPPGEERHLRDSFGELIYDVSQEEKIKFNDKSVKFYDIIQETGEIIFVPSGYHHQVWNLEDTISINHNWVNGCNILRMWLALQKELLSVMKEIEDCKEMENWTSHCQLMLKASYGMNYSQFFHFLSFIAERRIKSLNHEIFNISFDSWILGKNHSLFDLRQIKIVLEHLTKDANEKGIYNFLWQNNEVENLLKNIYSVLETCK
ncbi:2-oxoglutarate and iron-dependent oxygenase JMJD4 [Leptopilina heterotoma]|uniref:2-oxoglutarate and iron-dependent oxygenase JMJD4 n=1 Tax=Leptopilina heterotoma TaxID=63436 RepID=UPI001CAA0B5C|nr:2-oxoglutarate and iron-dependent oxygenase JMJD4 [Leptopilina heterotoma]